MKARKIAILSTLALVVALFGCNKTEYEGGVVPGESTYVNFAIDLGGSGAAGVAPGGGVAWGKVAQSGGGNDAATRADLNAASTRADANATDSEQKISRLRIYIFGGGVLESTGDISLNAGNVGTSYLAAKTGPKLIYAVANPRPDMIMPLGATLESFKTKAVAGTSADIAATDNFVMVGATNIVLQKRNEGAAMANPVPITVSRAAAKVQLKFNPASVKISPNMVGYLDVIAYRVVQTNSSMYLPRSGFEFTPLGQSKYQIDVGQDGTYDHLSRTDLGGNYGAAPEWSTDYPAFYVPENVNEDPCTGNTTFVLFSLRYAPDVSVIKGNDKVLVDGSFYVVKLGAGGDIYANAQEAEAAATAAGTTVKPYMGGWVYYRINIRNSNSIGSKSEIYSVIRNNFYKVNITELNGLGGNSHLDPDVIRPADPELPIEVDTYLSTTIFVEPWNPVVIDEPLG